MIPARIGSQRLKMKNLALIDGQPMISYAINASLNSNIFDVIVVNSDDEIFASISNDLNVEFYLRPENIGSSKASADDVVYDFMLKYPEADIVCWINPTSPLQTSAEINSAVEFFLNNNLDSLITVEDKNVHAQYNCRPLNYDVGSGFAQTQNIEPVQLFVYSVMIWRREAFVSSYEENKYGMFCGKFSVFPVSKLAGMIVKNEEDLMLCDYVMRGIREAGEYSLEYYDCCKDQ